MKVAPKHSPGRILFIPIEIGLAHISRSIALAEILQTHGYEVIVAVPARKRSIFAHSSVRQVSIKPITGRDRIDAVDVFKSKDKIRTLYREDLRLLRQYRPDICVVDLRLSALIATRRLSIPTFFLSNSDSMPFGSTLPNPGVSRFVWSVIRPFVQKGIRDSFDRNFLSALLAAAVDESVADTYDSLLKNVTFLIPEPARYLPPFHDGLTKHYIGTLHWKGFKKMHDDTLVKNNACERTAYVTFGGTGFDARALTRIVKDLLKEGWGVIVSTGPIMKPESLAPHPNLYVRDYLCGSTACALADIVICHGGFGSLMQAAAAGKPSVSLPYNPDQFFHALRFQELGLGVCTVALNTAYLSATMRGNWLDFESHTKNVSTDRVMKAVEKVMGRWSYYHTNILQFQKIIAHDEKSQSKRIEEIFSRVASA